MKQTKFKLHRGVTLVEIAIVLVIIGLLLGGVLKGQELINNAKVRAIADRQASLKVAWFSFVDRYQALPGDYVYAARYIPGSKNGDGDGLLTEGESPLIFQQLTAAGYLRCAQCTATETGNPSGVNSLVNNYGGIMAIFHDSSTYAAEGGPSTSPVLMVHTGGRIPSNIISEVDRKLDDSYANTGDVAFSQYEPNGSSVPRPDVADCINDATGGTSGALNATFVQDWRHATRSPPIVPNCGAAVRI